MDEDREDIVKNKSDLIEAVRTLANQCFECASQIEVTSRLINEKMKFMISVGEMNMGFAHMIGSLNGLTIAAVRVLQKINKSCSEMLEETHPDQVEVPLAPPDAGGLN